MFNDAKRKRSALSLFVCYERLVYLQSRRVCLQSSGRCLQSSGRCLQSSYPSLEFYESNFNYKLRLCHTNL